MLFIELLFSPCKELTMMCEMKEKTGHFNATRYKLWSFPTSNYLHSSLYFNCIISPQFLFFPSFSMKIKYVFVDIYTLLFWSLKAGFQLLIVISWVGHVAQQITMPPAAPSSHMAALWLWAVPFWSTPWWQNWESSGGWSKYEPQQLRWETEWGSRLPISVLLSPDLHSYLWNKFAIVGSVSSLPL